MNSAGVRLFCFFGIGLQADVKNEENSCGRLAACVNAALFPLGIALQSFKKEIPLSLRLALTAFPFVINKIPLSFWTQWAINKSIAKLVTITFIASSVALCILGLPKIGISFLLGYAIQFLTNEYSFGYEIDALLKGMIEVFTICATILTAQMQYDQLEAPSIS